MASREVSKLVNSNDSFRTLANYCVFMFFVFNTYIWFSEQSYLAELQLFPGAALSSSNIIFYWSYFLKRKKTLVMLRGLVVASFDSLQNFSCSSIAVYNNVNNSYITNGVL